jgi:hypothetical protein
LKSVSCKYLLTKARRSTRGAPSEESGPPAKKSAVDDIDRGSQVNSMDGGAVVDVNVAVH